LIRDDEPGPGTFNINKEFGMHRNFSFGNKYKHVYDDLTPGPG